MLLAANLGNTRLSVGLFPLHPAPAPPGEVGGAPVPLDTESAGLPFAASSGLLHLLPETGVATAARPRSVEAAVIASVNPPQEPAVRRWISDRFGVRARTFPVDVPPIIANRCRPPDAVGADRLANACAAWAERQTACIIVDAGTAVTVDAVASDGAFLGGAILPGPALLAKSLADGTALLPGITASVPSSVVGSETADAIRSGTWFGLAGAVDRLVHEVGSALGGADRSLITGGAAAELLPLCRAPLAHRPSLTLAGLAAAWYAAG
jgi:type III pantothenate kinase